MAFLDKTSLIVDAVITDKGREKLSTNSFIISEIGKRTDVEFNAISYEESFDKMNKADSRWKGF